MPLNEPGVDALRSWLRFVFAPGLGALAAARMLAEFGTPESALAAGTNKLAGLGFSRARIAALHKLSQRELVAPDPQLEALLAWGQHDRHAILTPMQAEYPDSLRAIPVPPPVLFRFGAPLIPTVNVAVVGARRATAAGCVTATALAGKLAEAGLTVVSGLAHGIDAAAHQGVLDRGGLTVAVLGCGPDVIYPRANAALYRSIVERGTVLSEFPPGAAPRKHHFPQRNRLISGLCFGTVVVEAGLRSGSLSTARHALEQGREVFAVPGSVHSPNSRGPHQLLRDGAHLVEDAQDVLNQLPEWIPNRDAGETEHDPVTARLPVVRPELREVWGALEFHPLSLDELIGRLGLPASDLSAALGELEADGHARMEGGGYAKICLA